MPVRADRDRFIQWFFEEVPRPALDEALMVSGDERLLRLHHALHDDVYRNVSPGTLCRRFGISWVDLMDVWHRHQMYSALLGMLNHLPNVMVGIAEDSESRAGACPVCDGIGYVAIDSIRYTCAECDGAGRVRVPGDAHARRQLFEILGLAGRKRGRPAVTESEHPARYPAYPISVDKK